MSAAGGSIHARCGLALFQTPPMCYQTGTGLGHLSSFFPTIISICQIKISPHLKGALSALRLNQPVTLVAPCRLPPDNKSTPTALHPRVSMYKRDFTKPSWESILLSFARKII